MHLFDSEIISREPLAAEIWRLRLMADNQFIQAAAPGRFVMLGSLGFGLDPFLLRPFGICRLGADWFEVVIKIVGKGSRQLCRLRPGERVRVHGPLGNGYPDPNLDESSWLILVAGGMGIVSLASYIFNALQNGFSLRKTILLYGASSKKELVLSSEINEAMLAGLEVQTITDDGSCGRQGLVTELLHDILQQQPRSIVFSCGPEAMLKRVQKIILENHCPGYLSLENRMACGFGVCLGCVQSVLESKRSDLLGNAKVCTDGPVFPAWKVLF